MFGAYRRRRRRHSREITKPIKGSRPARSTKHAHADRHVREPTVLSAMEQSPEDSYFGVRQPLGKRHPCGLHSGRRGTILESPQSRVVGMQSVLGSKYDLLLIRNVVATLCRTDMI